MYYHKDKFVELYNKDGMSYFYNFDDKNIYTIEISLQQYIDELKKDDDWFFTKYGVLISLVIYYFTRQYMEFSNTIIDIIVLFIASLVATFYFLKINKETKKNTDYINSKKSQFVKVEHNQEIFKEAVRVTKGAFIMLIISLISATVSLFFYFKYSVFVLVFVIVFGYPLSLYLILHANFYNKFKAIKEMKKLFN